MRNWFGWLLVLLTITMMASTARLILKETSLRRRVNTAQEENQSFRDHKKRFNLLQYQVWLASDYERRAFKKLSTALSSCRSREDFLVREGPWIVTHRLAASKPAEQRIGVYVPPGKHQLMCAFTEFSDLKYGSRQQFFFGDTRDLIQVESIELSETGEVYELRARSIDEARPISIQLELLGAENKILLDDNFLLPQGTLACTFSEPESLRVLSYPSELAISWRSKRRVAFRAFPHTDLLNIRCRDSNGTLSGLRIWIASHANACVSGIQLARHYDEITELSSTPRHLRAYDDLNQLFEPYSGNSSYQFREGVFSR